MNRLLILLATMLCICGCDSDSDSFCNLESKVVVDIGYNLRQQVDVREGFDPANVEALTEKVEGRLPLNVQVQFYKTETHELVKDVVVDAKGGAVSIEPGSYDLLIYSLATKATSVEGKTLNGKRAATQITHREYDIGGYRDVITEPDYLYIARIENVEVLPAKKDMHAVTYASALASSILNTYTFEMTDVEGMEYIAEYELFLTSQEGRSFLWEPREGNLPGALKLNAWYDSKKRRIYSIFNTFGRYKDYKEKVKVVLVARNTAGNQYIFDFDVTEQFDNPDNIGQSIVVDQHVNIPDDGSNGGFAPEVNPWSEPVIITD